MEYIKHRIILIVFVLALRYLFSVFSANNSGDRCSRGCGNKCAVSNLEKAMKTFEKDTKVC